MASDISMNGRKKIQSIQKEFTEKFTHLTIVFFDENNTELDNSKTLSDVRKKKGDDISIIASLKINTLEKRFVTNFGIRVQVAFKKDNQLIYTEENDDRTLNDLNKWCIENNCEAIGYTNKSKSSKTSDPSSNKTKTVNNDVIKAKNEFEKAVENYKNGNIEAVATYVQKGYPVLQFNQDGSLVSDYILFLVCATNYDIQSIKDALSIGLDPNVKNIDADAYTAAHFAAWDGKLDVLILLKEAGADLDIQGGDDRTPLHLACSLGHTTCVKFLLEEGANVESIITTPNHFHPLKGATPIRLAFMDQQWEVIDLLIEYGANLNELLEESSKEMYGSHNIFEIVRGLNNDPECSFLGNFDENRIIALETKLGSSTAPKSQNEVKGNIDNELGLDGSMNLELNFVTNIYLLKPYFIGLTQTQEIFDLFDQKIKDLWLNKFSDNILDEGIKNEHDINKILFESNPDSFLLMCKLNQEKIYESDRYENHPAYLKDIPNIINSLCTIMNLELKQAFVQMLVDLGNALDINVNEKMLPQDRYLPIFYAMNKWKDISTNDLEAAFKNMSHEMVYPGFYGYSMRVENLSEIEKMALGLYAFILVTENNELEIKVDDIEKARSIISSLYDYSTETMESRKEQLRLTGIDEDLIDLVNQVQYPALDQLIGGFDESFCCSQMLFFNCNFNTIDFLDQSILLFKDAASKFNGTTRASLANILKNQFQAELIREHKLADTFIAVLN
jgi:hypothetical protein